MLTQNGAADDTGCRIETGGVCYRMPEKQLGVIVWLHERVTDTLVGENARDPSLVLPSNPSEVTIIVMEYRDQGCR